jgi:hypothetical protein
MPISAHCVPQYRCRWGGIPVPIECETGWLPEPVWAVLWTRKSCASAEIQFSGHLARG